MKTTILLLVLALALVPLAAAFDEAALLRELDVYAKAKQEIFCWKKTYGRGVGTVPKSCGDNEYDAGLCYPHCREGYKGVGPVCWQRCKEGYNDHGATCYKFPGFYFKSTYGRGVGKVPTDCGQGRQYDAGLCYPTCNQDYKGVGPVCWKTCANYTPVDCGAACGSSSRVCVEKIFNMVKTVLEMVKNIAELIVSFGGSAAAKSVTEALKSTFKVAKNFIAKGISKQTFIKFMKSHALKIGKTVAESTLNGIFDQATKAQDLALDIASSFDPIGIIDVVRSFIFELC